MNLVQLHNTIIKAKNPMLDGEPCKVAWDVSSDTDEQALLIISDSQTIMVLDSDVIKKVNNTIQLYVGVNDYVVTL